MARNYRKDGGGMDIDPTPTPTPEPPRRRSKTPNPTMSPTATGYALRGTDRTPTPTPWPPKMYGTPTPEYLEYLGYPMGVREMGGGSGFGYNGTGGGGGIASKRMRKSKNPNPSDPYMNSGMYDKPRYLSTVPSRSDAYIPYTTDPDGERLTPEQRGRMKANSATGNLKFLRDIFSSTKVQDKIKNSLMSVLAYTPLGAVLGGGMKGAEFVQSIPSTKTYQSATQNAKEGIRGVQMLPKAVREANQSALNELKGRSYADYAIDTIGGKASSIGDSVRSSGRKTIDSTRDALAQGYKQRESDARNSRGIGELIGAAEALGFGDKQRKELLDMGGRTAGKAGKVATIAAQYHPAVMMANYLMNQIPSNVRARGVAGNAKSAKNVVSDFITNSGRKASAYGSKALADAGNSISSWFDKSATSSRGSRSMSKSLKSNKKSNKYF